MENSVDDYAYAGGYGIFCGKKCVAEKQAQGIAPKRGSKNIAEFEALQAQAQRQYQLQQEQSSGGSKTGLIIGGVLLLGVVGTIIYIVKKRKSK
jgi:hypothetical protein